ncbi:MAG: RNA polymerase sigma factor [Saprospiraceae bacterium]
MPNTPLYPEKLLRACLRNDRQGQYELYQRYKVYLFGVCMRYAKNRAEAEDILQEGFYKILRDLKQYNRKVTLQSWMRKVMVNSALMHIRKHHKLKLESTEPIPEINELLVDNSLLETNRANAVIQLIQQLPITQQTVFNLRAIEGYSFKEIAQQLETNEATLRSYYRRARLQLQQLLQKEW